MRPGKKRLYLQQTREAGGYYVLDCHPWAIKGDCARLDCPMRTMMIPPEPKATDFLINCNPSGELADFILTVRLLSEV